MRSERMLGYEFAEDSSLSQMTGHAGLLPYLDLARVLGLLSEAEQTATPTPVTQKVEDRGGSRPIDISPQTRVSSPRRDWRLGRIDRRGAPSLAQCRSPGQTSAWAHCVRLAGGKADLWWLRQHPRMLELKFHEGLNRAEKNNAIDGFLSDDLTPPEEACLLSDLGGHFPKLSREEKTAWIGELSGVSLGSDAYFPFRDSIDRASRSGWSISPSPAGRTAMTP